MDPAKMKVVDLRSELGALGLDTKGNKPALVERLKKALEAKTGKAIADTTILDTSTEGDDEGTPRRAGPAARTRRRSSSSRLAATPAKQVRKESPEPIEEVKEEGHDRYSPQHDSDSNAAPEPVAAPVKDKTPVKEPPPVKESPAKMQTPVKEKSVEPEKPPVEETEKTPNKGSELYSIDDESQSPVPEKSADEEMKDQEEKQSQEDAEKKDGDETKDGVTVAKMDVDEEEKDDKRPPRELTEEEEWEQLNERLKQKEKERVEREKQQAEEDAKKLEELANDPVKLNRLKRKMEKKARWNNFYRSVEVTNEVLTPPNEDDYKIKKGKKEIVVETKSVEPEIDESKISLSWYDSDLNQYLEDDLSGTVPLSEGAFAHAWAGVRASHGVNSGRVCYEVRVGSVITTTESTEKEVVSSGIRVGWSTDDSSLHLGDGEHSWGYETTGRVVNNSEFKEYGKKLEEKDVIGAYLDLESNPCKIFFTVNGIEQGTAFEFDKSSLEGKTLFPHVLTKNQCYRVNFGYDRYNMITKTKIVRNRLEIPVEQVLEEKRAREEELKKQKEEALRKEKERREKEKAERDERNRKKREEREKQEKERKEREAQEKRDRGEEVDEDKEKEKEKEKDGEAMDTDKPQENGDKPVEETAVEVKIEPMDAETPAEETPAAVPAATEETPAPAPPPPPADATAVKEEQDGEALKEVTEEQVLQGHVLDKRIQFVIRYTVDEELEGPEAQLVPGYLFIKLANLVPGPRPPASIADAEVILMVGMPGAGKTHWAKQHCAENPHKRYNILSTGALFDHMKVDCKPFKATYEGRWDAFVSKCAKCVLKLLEMARGRRRNFILDQRRKLREFDGYRRIAVVIVTDEQTYKERFKRREEADGKEVPDPAILDMKANFTLPEKCAYIDEVRFPELSEEEARQVLDAFHKEAKAAGVVKEKERRERSAGREPPNKRARDDKRHGRDDRDRSREFRDRDRWGGGGSRWGGSGGGRGGAAGGGSRWGGRDSRGGRDSGPPARFDRWGGPPRDFGNRDRDNFRGGRGGPGGPGGPPRGDRGPGGRPGGPPGADRGGFNRDNRGPRGMVGDKKSSGPPGGFGNQGGGGGGGSWQRGGQMAPSNRGGNMGMMGNRGGMNNQGSRPAKPESQTNQAGGQQQNQQGWNQWAGGWGGWGNWNQNQAANWGQWGNWGNWNQGQNQAAGQQGNQQQGNKGQQNQQQQQQQQQWPANYTAQQWYQWQQWQQQQQQQQGWAGYGQQQQGNQQQPTAQEAQQAWAQYYQNYGANAGGNTAGALTGGDKK